DVGRHAVDAGDVTSEGHVGLCYGATGRCSFSPRLPKATIPKLCPLQGLVDAQLARLAVCVGDASVAQPSGLVLVARASTLEAIADQRGAVERAAALVVRSGALHALTDLRIAHGRASEVRAVIVGLTRCAAARVAPGGV